MRLLVVCSLALWAAPALAEDRKDKPAAEKLVGTWRLTGGDNVPEGVAVTVEFTKDGKMVVRFEPKDKTADAITLKGTYKVEKDKIDYEIDDGSGGKKAEVVTVTKLTADELATTDPAGIKEEFKREKKDDKKKDEKKKDDR